MNQVVTQLALQQYSHKIFLDSLQPEQKLMAIFGNFDNEAPVEVIKKILEGIDQQADGELRSPLVLIINHLCLTFKLARRG